MQWQILLEYLAKLLGISVSTQQLLANPNGPNSLVSIGTEVRALTVYDASSLYGFPAVLDTLTGMIADATLNQAALLAAITALGGGGGPVTLPTIPPAGYGGAAAVDIADAVWLFLIGTDGLAAGQLLAGGAQAILNDNLLEADITAARYFRPIYWAYNALTSAGITQPVFDPHDILVGETLLTNLERQNPLMSCAWWEGVNGHVAIYLGGAGAIQSWVTLLDEPAFQELALLVNPAAMVSGAPIWPGLANVTLGTSVALDRTVTLTEVMDGVIVTLTGVPPGKPTYVLGALTATAHIGQIAFVADNGAAEYPQNLSFASEIYVPLALVGASAVVLRTIPGVTGTVQAWTRTL